MTPGVQTAANGEQVWQREGEERTMTGGEEGREGEREREMERGGERGGKELRMAA